VAQALTDCGVEHLPFLNGADQESRRINAYVPLNACFAYTTGMT